LSYLLKFNAEITALKFMVLPWGGDNGATENARPGKCWTKSQSMKMQDLENDGPNRRSVKCRT